MAQHAEKEFKATQEAGVVKMRQPVHFPSINAIPQTIAFMCMTGTTFLDMWPMVRMGAVALAFDQMNGLICIRDNRAFRPVYHGHIPAKPSLLSTFAGHSFEN